MNNVAAMDVPAHIVATIGRANLRSNLGIADTAISNALAQGTFPASWYGVLKPECDRLGIDCPMRLFSFKQPPEPDAHPAPSDADSEGA